jgi:hypothetical protein
MFDKLEEIDAREDLEFKDKIKLFDQILKNIWQAGRANMEYKKLMLRAPDIAQNRDLVLELGAIKELPKVEAQPQ